MTCERSWRLFDAPNATRLGAGNHQFPGQLTEREVHALMWLAREAARMDGC